jgi:hypothetical protein
VRVSQEVDVKTPVQTDNLEEPIVLLPIGRWTLVSEKALRYAWTLSHEIQVLHVECGDKTDELRRQWSEFVEKPAKAVNLPLPQLVVLESPYRFIVKPIVDYAVAQQAAHPERNVMMVIPQLVESHWYHYLLHDNRPEAIRAFLLFNSEQRITVVSIPYNVKS